MAFDPIVVDSFDLGYTLLSAFVVVFGLLSLFLKERLYIGEAVWATVFGIIVGPYCAGIFNPRNWGAVTDYNSNDITIQVTRIVLSVGVFAIGVELPKAYVGRHWKSLTFLLVPIMIFGWFVSSAFIYALIPGVDYLSSLAIAACLTPTDPILAAAVVGGRYAEKHVPAHLRHLLAAESGVNDGAAFPMLFISLYLILDKTDGAAVGHWFYITWIYEIVLGTVLGAVLGYVARHAMKYCERHDLIDRHSYVAQYISLALLSNGITTILGSDDLLSSFACGTAFAYDGWFNKKTEETLFSNVIDLIFNCACFIYIGAWIPFGDFNDQSLGGITWWRLFIIGLLVIILRRLPVMLLLYKWIPEVKTFREAVFSGHFGPMGVGAVFISTLAVQSMPEFYPQEAGRPPETQLELLSASIQPIVAFIVLMSIAIHGLSIPFFSLGKRVHSISRTWSRHTSLEPTGTPEWAQQARRIRPGEEIVINRDRDDREESLSKLERGELPPRSASPEGIPMTPTSSGSGSRPSLDEKRRLDEEHRLEEERLAQEQEAAEARGEHVDGVTERRTSLERQPGGEGHAVAQEQEHRDERGERPPITVRAESGGSNVIPDREQRPGDETEWREGNDLIIERKIADGEEVEVEVIRDRFHDELPSMSKVIRGAKDNIRSHLDREAKAAKEGMHELQRQMSPKSNRSASPTFQVVQEWKPFSNGNANAYHAAKGKEEETTTAPKRTNTRSSSKDDEEDDEARQSSSDTEGADVEDNRGEGTSSGAVLDPQAGPSNPASRSPSPGGDTRESSETKQTQSRVRGGRRESIRRKLFGRTRFARSAAGSKSKSKRSAGKARQSQSDAEESEEDGDGETEVEADSPIIRRDMYHSPTSAETERQRNRSRSESPHPLRLSEPHLNTGSERQRRRARFQLPAPQSRDEVEDPASLSSAPSPNVLHQKLDTLVANSERDESQQPQSRQGSGSTSGHSHTHSRVQSLGGRSIRFAEQEGPFIRSGSSSSLQRLGQTHQHLHYQHSSARRASPGPGSSTPRRNHTPHSYTPTGSHIHNHYTSGDET